LAEHGTTTATPVRGGTRSIQRFGLLFEMPRASGPRIEGGAEHTAQTSRAKHETTETRSPEMARRLPGIVTLLFVGLLPAGALGGLLGDVIDALHGFPASYEDANGLVLEPCLATTGGCGPADEVPVTFPNPVIYWVAEARMYTYGGKGGNPDATRPGGQATATLRMELLGTYPLDANGDRVPVAGQELVLQSLQVRIDSLLDGELYTVTTPFGVFDNIPANVDFDATGQRTRNVDSIKETFQLPADPITPGNFDQSAYPASPYSSVPWSFSGMDVFLTCAGIPPQPSGFLGSVVDILGVPTLVECTIQGSPLGPSFDVFRVEGPEVGGGPLLWAGLEGAPFATGLGPWVPGEPSIDVRETTQFRITGQVVSSSAAVPSVTPMGRLALAALLLGLGLCAPRWRRGLPA
jgi:hypothetical protein